MSAGSGPPRLGLAPEAPGTSPDPPDRRPAPGRTAALRAAATTASSVSGVRFGPARRLGPRLLPPDAGDVDALAGAWADPAIAAANGVPQDASVSAAARWLAGDPSRLQAGRSLDLVVSPLAPCAPGDRAAARDVADTVPERGRPVRNERVVVREPPRGRVDPAAVLGEVGLRNIDRVRRRAEISWWTTAGHRGRGLATAATRLLTAWALDPAGGGLVQIWARIDPANSASARVAAAAGLELRGSAGGADIWARAAP